MRKSILALTFAASAVLVLSAPAQAQYCEGKVHGLSAHYNPHTGAGFLAVRSKPRASSHQRGALLNGDTVEIFTRKGNWYKIATTEGDMLEGWAHARWIRNDCNY
jgi:uncharacterized protein YgiM (DUF1202 family)